MSPVPGLVIVREPGPRESLAVLHAPSERAIILDLAGQATAELAAEDLGKLELDWTLSPSELASAADLLVYVEGAVERIAGRYGGTTLGGSAVYVW
jgi:hypothetical protein